MPVDQPSPRDRGEMMRRFENRPGDWMNLTLLLISMGYAVSCRPIREKLQNRLFIPGCGFGNPVQAWEAGLNEKEAFC